MLSTNRQDNSVLSAFLRPGVAFVVIIFGALLAFEIFNFSTTELALTDLLGDLTFAGLPWSLILALAFCGIDFAGVARLFTPEQGQNEPKEVWYLFGAWLLAATMNAILTWWGVSMAVVNHTVQSQAVVDPKTITGVVPVFVAVMVWVIRILIIGTLSLAMDRLLHPGAVQQQGLTQRPMETRSNYGQAAVQTNTPSRIPGGFGNAGTPSRSIAAKGGANQASPRPRVEPEYHSMSGRGKRS
ncbi:MAG: hypothetical protein IH586_02355 [Anaerolineaceae bacterium]|nr:hypothetical protein [Anaerolineaceae bacterium]